MTTTVTFSATNQSRISNSAFGRRGKRADLLATRPAPTGVRGPHTRLKVLLADVQPGTPLMQQLHTALPTTADLSRRPEGPQGQRVWSTCPRQQSTVPVSDPNAILTYELTGITDTSASRTNATPIFPPPQRPSAAAPVPGPKIIGEPPVGGLPLP